MRKFKVSLNFDSMSISGKEEDVKYVIDNWVEEEYINDSFQANGYRFIDIKAPSEKLYSILTHITWECENDVVFVL